MLLEPCLTMIPSAAGKYLKFHIHEHRAGKTAVYVMSPGIYSVAAFRKCRITLSVRYCKNVVLKSNLL